MIFEITEELEKDINRLWGKPLSALTDDDAKAIVEQYTDILVKNASFTTENEIYYTEETEEENDENEVFPCWSEQYLNTLGMSLSDF